MRTVYRMNDLQIWEPGSGHSYLVLPLAFYEGWEGRRVLAWVLGRIQSWGVGEDVVKPGVQSLGPGWLRNLMEQETYNEDVRRLTGELDREDWEKKQKEEAK